MNYQTDKDESHTVYRLIKTIHHAKLFKTTVAVIFLYSYNRHNVTHISIYRKRGLGHILLIQGFCLRLWEWFQTQVRLGSVNTQNVA